jgi:hypothetical protein
MLEFGSLSTRNVREPPSLRSCNPASMVLSLYQDRPRRRRRYPAHPRFVVSLSDWKILAHSGVPSSDVACRAWQPRLTRCKQSRPCAQATGSVHAPDISSAIAAAPRKRLPAARRLSGRKHVFRPPHNRVGALAARTRAVCAHVANGFRRRRRPRQCQGGGALPGLCKERCVADASKVGRG